MKFHAVVGIVGAALLFACGDAPTTDAPGAQCGWSKPHRLFTTAAGDQVVGFGPSTDIVSRWYDIGGALFFSDREAVYSSGYCGEDLAPARAGDGMWHLHEGLAIDCDTGVVLRGDSDATLAPVLEGVRCDWLVTPEGILGSTLGPGGDAFGAYGIPLRLIDFGAPELPVMALSDEPVRPLAGHVGPRDVAAVAMGHDRLATGHFASPYLMLTQGGTVLHVDRDTWRTTPLLDDVAELVPSPDGQAFAYRPKLADDAPGDMRVRIVASGAEFAVASADEVLAWSDPWWSVDGSMFAVSIVVVGDPRDRVLSLPSGVPVVAPPHAYVQRELADGAVWLTAYEPAADREFYWEPFTGVIIPISDHMPLPKHNRRASADGLEIIDPPQRVGSLDIVPGTLKYMPWDGAATVVLAEDIYPWYQRLADGRVVTVRATGEDFEPGDPGDLVIIDGDEERVIDRQVIGLGPLLVNDGEPGGGYFRVVGDLLIYAVGDDAGGRSGVWAVNLSRL